MAHISVFDYHIGSSILHRLDVRFKLVILIAFNLALTRAGIEGLAGLSVVLILLLAFLRISIGRILFEMRVFLILLLAVFTARSLSEPGVSLISYRGLAITMEGVQIGGIVCWRLFQIVLLGLFFIRTSRPWEIKVAIQWFLSPIPGVPAHRISLMISLMFRFIPMIMELYSEISEAQQSRAVALRKNPFFRMKVLVIPLLENTFRKADEMALAMEARCYSDRRTDPILRSGRKDWLLMILSGIGCLLLLVV